MVKENVEKREKPVEWNLILINNNNPLSENYTMEFVTLFNGYKVDERIYPSLQEMFDNARNERVYPRVNSGYITNEEQQKLYDDRINMYLSQSLSMDEAVALTNHCVALPGCSEHEAAIAVDIGGDWVNSTSREVYDWLEENAYKYGFILRYPEGKTEITGMQHEPWHYRFVGKEVAKEIYEKELTLEEYLDTLN
ncbi:MAG: D-Ala-D-Ala carboxypeptidase VanY [Candidatus Epulonipiscioides saccharophilum]|nr:MAG: D-Ala-D-Ala carboxypeptidase VanY [Epulopiscium sp. AS2M-Bin001]